MRFGPWPAPAGRSARRWLALLCLLVSALADGRLAAREDSRDPVAQWALQRMVRNARVDRLPRVGAKILVIPVGAPASAEPAPLTGSLVRAIIEKLDDYSGPQAPEPIDGVLFEINASGGLVREDLESVLKLTEVLQIHDYPVFAWVHGAALDEAAWIALACDRIYADPQAQLGGGPFDPLRDPAEQGDPAVMEFTASKARFAADLAGMSGFNGDLAAAMTDGRLVLHRVTLDGQPTVLTDTTIAAVRAQRPDATIAVGAVFKPRGDRLRLSGAALYRPDINLVAGQAATRQALWADLGVTQAQMIEMQLSAPPGRSWRALIQVAALLGVVVLALFLLVCELWMETRGYALVAAGGLLLSYLTWAAFQTRLGPVAMLLFVFAVAAIVIELFKPSRRGLRAVLAFGAIGLGLGLTLLNDLPGLDPTWRMRHLQSEYWPAIGSAALVAAGSGLSAAAVGLLALLRLKRTARYQRRWRKRFEAWDDSLFLALQAQVGKHGHTRSAIAPPPANAPALAAAHRPRLAAPDREARFDAEGQSVGEVEIDGRRFPATCTGSIAADQPVAVVDCTEERLIVRHLPSAAAPVPPWQTHSKYAADPAATKYTATESAADDAARYAERERKLKEEPLRYQAAPPEEQAKYPPKIDETKYGRERKVSGGSKYRPEGEGGEKAAGED